MKDFVTTGWYALTLTTADDPELKVIETDNGVDWVMKFYVGNHLIDSINMEYPKNIKLHHSVKNLPVYGEDGMVSGSVEKNLNEAIDLCHVKFDSNPCSR